MYYGYIYITTNNLNGRKYIGKHKSNIFDESYTGSGVAIEQAVKKYGKNNFSIQVIQWCNSLQELNEQEKYWINYYNANNDENFYNIAAGGDGGCVWGKPENHPSCGKHYSKERVEKTAQYCRGSKVLTKNGIRKWVHRDELEKYFQDGWISTADINKQIQQQRHENFNKLKEERRIKKEEKEQKRKEMQESREIMKQKKQKLMEEKIIKKQEREQKKMQNDSNKKSPKSSWCKGLTKETDERVRKIAESKIGKPSKTRGQKRTDEQRRHLSEGGKGKHPRNEEAIEKYKTTMKNKTEEEKELIKKHLSESHIGKIWINNGNQVLYINKEDFDIYEKQGYKRGRKIK